jgi:hypothetical protein
MEDEYWTTKELAEHLRASEETVRGWRSRGGGPPFVKVKGLIRYRIKDVRAFLYGRTVRDEGGE